MPSMVELVIPVGTDIPDVFALEAANLSAEIIKLIDRTENLWDGPGGTLALKTSIQNVIGLSRTRAEMWLDEVAVSKILSGGGAVPRQSPGNVIASVGDSLVSHLAEKIVAKIKASISRLLTAQGTGGIQIKDIPFARTMLSITMQRVKNQYDCEEGIVHTNNA